MVEDESDFFRGVGDHLDIIPDYAYVGGESVARDDGDVAVEKGLEGDCE